MATELTLAQQQSGYPTGVSPSSDVHYISVPIIFKNGTSSTGEWIEVGTVYHLYDHFKAAGKLILKENEILQLVNRFPGDETESRINSGDLYQNIMGGIDISATLQQAIAYLATNYPGTHFDIIDSYGATVNGTKEKFDFNKYNQPALDWGSGGVSHFKKNSKDIITTLLKAAVNAPETFILSTRSNGNYNWDNTHQPGYGDQRVNVIEVYNTSSGTVIGVNSYTWMESRAIGIYVPAYLVIVFRDSSVIDITGFYPAGIPFATSQTENENTPPDDSSPFHNTFNPSGTVGGGGSNVQARNHNINNWNDAGTFDYLYIPSDIDLTQNTSGIVIGTGANGGLAGINYVGDARFNTNINIKTLKRNLTSSDILILEENTKFDAAGTYILGERIYVTLQDQVYFRGNVKTINRILTSTEQVIKYTVVGIRTDLRAIPFSIMLQLSNYTLSDLFQLVLNKIPSSVVADWDISVCPSIIIPRIQSSITNVGDFIDQLLQYAGHYSYYVDNTGKFTLIDLKSGTQRSLAIPPEGTVRTIGDGYRIISQKLNFDISKCKTRALLYGDFYVKTFKTSTYLTFDNIRQLYYIVVNTYGGELLSSLPEGGQISFTIQTNNAPIVVTPIHINIIKHKIWFDLGQTKRFGGVLIYGIKFNPIFADTGWQGTAYTNFGIQKFIFKLNTNYKKFDLANNYHRDDSQLLLNYANKLIEPYKDTQWGGQIILDGLATDINLGDRLNLTGATSNWAGLNMVVMSIEWDFSQKTTMLELTSNFWLYSGIIDARLDFKDNLKYQKFINKNFQYEVIQTPTHIVG